MRSETGLSDEITAHGLNRSLRLDFSEVVQTQYGCLAVSRVPSELLLR